MKNFFRALDRRGAAHLLISGQACVVYGASDTSEDFDLWVRPTARDLAALASALRDVGARVYKLTPPLDLRYARRGHGFHFVLPASRPGNEVFLDVMFRPPRTGDFMGSLKRARIAPTPWGKVPVVSIEDLVEIKKTRRERDYEAISNLARIRLESALHAKLSGAALGRVTRFALDNAYRLEALTAIYGRAPNAAAYARRSSRASVRGISRISPRRLADEGLPAGLENRILAALGAEKLALFKADAAYWRPIIYELRELRRRGDLMPIGSPVPEIGPH